MKFIQLLFILVYLVFGCKKKNAVPNSKKLINFANIKNQNGSTFYSHIIYNLIYRGTSNDISSVIFNNYFNEPTEFQFVYKNEIVEKIEVYSPSLKKISQRYLFSYNTQKQLTLVEVNALPNSAYHYFWEISYKNNKIYQITYLETKNSTDRRYNYIFDYDPDGKVNNVVVAVPNGTAFPRQKITFKYDNLKLINPFSEIKNLWLWGFIGENQSSENSIIDPVISSILTFQNKFCPTQIKSEHLDEPFEGHISNATYRIESSGKIMTQTYNSFEISGNTLIDTQIFFSYQFNYDFR